MSILILGGTTLGLSRLRPAPPTVDRATVWVDTVKRGEMLREVRGLGTLVPVDIRWIPARNLRAGGQDRPAIRRNREAGLGDRGIERPATEARRARRRIRLQGGRSRPRQPESPAREQPDGPKERGRRHRKPISAGEIAGGR